MAQKTDGQRLLAQWMKREKLGPRAAGRRLEVDHAQVIRLLSGDRRPGLDLAIRMHTVAGIPEGAWGDRGGDR